MVIKKNDSLCTFALARFSEPGIVHKQREEGTEAAPCGGHCGLWVDILPDSSGLRADRHTDGQK